VEDDEDGDDRFVWEGILGSIRMDQSSETYPIGSFQAFVIIKLLLYQCLLALLLLVPALSISVPLWIVLASHAGTDVTTKLQEPTGSNLTPVLRRSENQNPVVVDKVLTSHRSLIVVPTVFAFQEEMGPFSQSSS